jgi:hypothetical protein
MPTYERRYVDEKGVLRDSFGYMVKQKDRKFKKLNWDVALQICELVSLGYSLTKVCELYGHKRGWPKSTTTWYKWCRLNPELKEMYDTAQEDRADTYVDHIIRVVDAVEQGNTTVDIAKFVTDQLKWIAEKHKPRKYGAQKQVSTDQEGGPAKIEFNVILGDQKDTPKQVEAISVEALPVPGDEEKADE